MRPIGLDTDRNIQESITRMMPKIYESSKVVEEVIKADAAEMELFHENLNDVFAQYFIETATWGLKIWENMLLIATDESKTYEERRGVIRSVLRRFGTSTQAMIKNVAESYVNGAVEITEYNGEYRLNIKFIGERGRPTNLDDVKTAIRAVTPSHIALTYELTFFSFAEMEQNNYTWNILSAKTWEQFETSFS